MSSTLSQLWAVHVLSLLLQLSELTILKIILFYSQNNDTNQALRRKKMIFHKYTLASSLNKGFTVQQSRSGLLGPENIADVAPSWELFKGKPIPKFPDKSYLLGLYHQLKWCFSCPTTSAKPNIWYKYLLAVWVKTFHSALTAGEAHAFCHEECSANKK